jgi:DNA-3-methyladenine glycosylase
MVRPKRSTPYKRLARAQLPLDTVSLAQDLIGKILVRETAEGVISGRIVETEAYPVGDPAGHAYRGMTTRNRSLFLGAGHAYVYMIYGTSYMLNVASEVAGVGAGVLIRALAPMEGLSIMARNRGAEDPHQLTRGPGRLARALQIDRRLDGIDLCRAGPLWLACDDQQQMNMGKSVRIGLSRGAELALRFYLRGSRFVSGPSALNR